MLIQRGFRVDQEDRKLNSLIRRSGLLDARLLIATYITSWVDSNPASS